MKALAIVLALVSGSARAAIDGEYVVEGIDSTSAEQLIAYIDAHPNGTIRFYFNSPGGSVDAMYNIIRRMERAQRSGTRFICTAELAASAGAAIFSSCDVRLALPRALFLIHPVASTVRGNADEVRKVADQMDAITNAYLRHCARHVTIPFSELKRRALRQYWFDAAEAVQIGFVQYVVP